MDKSKKEVFQNRREKAVRPVVVRLSQIQDKMGASRRRMMALIALPVIALILLGSAYVMFAQERSQQVNVLVSADKTKVQAQIKAFGVAYTKASQKEKLSLIAQQVAMLRIADCGSSNLLYPSLVGAMEHCGRYNESLRRLQSDFKDIALTLQYDASVRNTLAVALRVDVDLAANWDTEQATWQAASIKLGKMTPSPEAKDAHTALVKQTGGVAKAWGAMQTANKAQKLKDYYAAKKNLAAQYQKLRKISESFTTDYTALQADLLRSYKLVIN